MKKPCIPSFLPVLMRRYASWEDIDEVIDRSSTMDPSSPFHPSRCEWGLLMKVGDGLDYAAQIQRARAHGITVIPGFRLGDQWDDGGYGQGGTNFLDPTHWNSLLRDLETCTALMDSSCRIMFDVETYSKSGSEPRLSDYSPEQRALFFEQGFRFFALIRAHGVVPLINPGTIDTAMVHGLLQASGGMGMILLYADALQVAPFDLLFHDLRKAQDALHSPYQEMRYWEQHYPDVQYSMKTSVSVMRKALQPWRHLASGAAGFTWVDDSFFRPFDFYANNVGGVNRFATEAFENYTAVTPNFMQHLRHAWQPEGLRTQFPDTNGILRNYMGDRVTGLRENVLLRGGLNVGTSSATRGITTDQWPTTRSSSRKGSFGEMPVPDPRFPDYHPCYVIPSTLHKVPWTVLLTIAVDPLARDEEGRNGWERCGITGLDWCKDGMLLKQGFYEPFDDKKNLFRAYFKRIGERVELHFEVVERFNTNGTSASTKKLSLQLPAAMTSTYQPIRVLLGLDQSAMFLGIEQGSATPLFKEQPITLAALGSNGAYVSAVNDIGPFPFMELLSCYIWNQPIRQFPQGEWPFNEKIPPALVSAP